MTDEPVSSETPETRHNREHDYHCGHLMAIPGGKKSGIDCDVIAAVRHRYRRYGQAFAECSGAGNAWQILFPAFLSAP
jgi:hypothetical protein